MNDSLGRFSPGRRKVLLGLLIAVIPAALALRVYSNRWVEEARRNREAVAAVEVSSAGKATNEIDLARESKELESRVQQNPRDGILRLETARRYSDLQQFMPALTHAEEAVRLNPGSSEAHFLLAMILTTLDYRQEAVTHYREAIRLDAKNLEAFYRLGTLYAAMDRPGDAEATFREATKSHPDSPGAWLSLGDLFVQQKKWPQARDVLKRALAINPELVGARYLMGYVAHQQARTDEAEGHYRFVLTQREDFADANHQLGSLLANQARIEEGVRYLERAVQLESTNATFWYALANAYRRNKERSDHLERAVDAFQHSIELSPRLPWAHYYYGVTLVELGDTIQAIREFNRALEINPGFGSAHYQLGLAYRKLGDASKAREYLKRFDREGRQAISEVHGRRRDESFLDTADEHYRRGLEAQKSGNVTKAMAEFRLALERDPDHVGAQARLSGLESRPRLLDAKP